MLTIKQSVTVATPDHAPWGYWDEKAQDVWSQIAEVHIKGMSPESCVSP